MRRSLYVLLAGSTLIAACEDGPDQLFTPNSGDPPAQNGYTPAPPWVQPGDTSFEDKGGGSDSAGRAQFCDETVANELVQWMVTQPIIPDTSVGGVPMRNPDGTPLHADSLLGKREDGKFCDPSGVYLDAFTWGPTDEVIVFFNQETRLVEGLIAYQQYLGTLEGSYTAEGGAQVPVFVRPRERLRIDGRDLDQYTSRREQADKTNAWLNHKNVTKFYRMIRETFFDAAPFPEDYDCVADKACDLIYTSGSDAVPQDTFIVIQDSGIQIRFTPEGQAQFVYLLPVRGAPFEKKGGVAFGRTGMNQVEFAFTSTERPNCRITLDEELTFAEFKTRCIDNGDMRTLQRVSYDVEVARDAVQAGFVGMDLGFVRQTSTSTVFRDGEPPKDTDVLYSMLFTRSLDAEVEEFRPQTLGNAYKPKLEQRLRDAIVASGPIPADQHPFYSFDLRVPFIFDTPQRIGELTTSVGNDSWIPQVINEITALYHSLPLAQQQMVDPRVIDPVFIVEPFVDAVIDVFSHGESNAPGAVKRFRTTDDRRWSIGDLAFLRGGVPYRMQVQYSLNFGAVTAVSIERGYSEIDQLFLGVKTSLGDASPYYTLALSKNPGNPYGLGGAGIVVNGFDRRLNTLDVTLETRDGAQVGSVDLIVSGDPIQDRNGYLRQIRGQRYEFVPSNVVRLYGKETAMRVFVEADGTIGRAEELSYKGEIELCAGLSIEYGDDVPRAVQAWAARSEPDDYRDCEIVFNYSENGNILDSVASLSNRVEITVVDKRAVTAALWR